MARKQLTAARRQPRIRLDQVLMMRKRSVSLLLCLSGLLGVGCITCQIRIRGIRMLSRGRTCGLLCTHDLGSALLGLGLLRTRHLEES